MSEKLSDVHLVYSYDVKTTAPERALVYAVDSFRDRFGSEPGKLLVALGFPLSRTPAEIAVENNGRIHHGQIWMPVGKQVQHPEHR